MPRGRPVQLAVNQKASTYRALSEAMDGVWQGKLRLPRGLAIQKNVPSMLVVTVDRTAFTLEFDAVAI